MEKARGVPADDLGAVGVEDRLGREAEPGGVTDARRVPAEVVGRLGGATEDGVDLTHRLVEDPREQRAEDQREEDRDAADEALEGHGADDREEHRQQGDPLVLRPVDVGHDGREVEADEHDDGAGDDGRQHLVQHPGTDEVDRDADEREDESGDEDRAGDLRGVTALGTDGCDTTDEGGGRAEVGSGRGPGR